MKWYLSITMSLLLMLLSGCEMVSQALNKPAAAPASVEGKADVAASASHEKPDYIFSAPPRESAEEGAEQYGAIAAYLSKVTGKKIEYVHQDNWMSYLQGIRDGKYDIAFDGPHFNAWRNRYLDHEPVARIDFPCSEEDSAKANCKTFKPAWYLVYRTGTDTGRLSGRTFCLHAPPNFATLSLLHTKFSDVAHQPYIKEMKGWMDMVTAVRDNTNKCEFTVSRMKHIKQADPTGEKLVYEAFDSFVQQGFTVSKKIPPEIRAKIKQALTSEEGRRETAAFHARFITEKHALRPYDDSSEYDKAFDILAQQYLIPWALFKYPTIAMR